MRVTPSQPHRGHDQRRERPDRHRLRREGRVGRELDRRDRLRIDPIPRLSASLPSQAVRRPLRPAAAVWVSAEFGQRLVRIDPDPADRRVVGEVAIGNRPRASWLPTKVSGSRFRHPGAATAEAGSSCPVVLGLDRSHDLRRHRLLRRGDPRLRRAYRIRVVSEAARSSSRTLPRRFRRRATGQGRTPSACARAFATRTATPAAGGFRRGSSAPTNATAICPASVLSNVVVRTRAPRAVLAISRGNRAGERQRDISPERARSALRVDRRGSASDPPQAPRRALHQAISGGRYAIQSYAPGRQLKLVGNPHFCVGSEAARPRRYADEIVSGSAPNQGKTSQR